uniref:Uncharacterized protein n=1 Tax=Anguilla anguilla TaxID=7936 RepID=A0A0E9T3S6_ANGAN
MPKRKGFAVLCRLLLPQVYVVCGFGPFLYKMVDLAMNTFCF